MDTPLFCKLFFGLGFVVDLGGTLIPSFREKIMNYGSRGTSPNSPAKKNQPEDLVSRFMGILASVQVPHTWFTHYYVVSVLSSIFWAQQIYTYGPALQLLASYSPQGTPTMSVNQVFLAWSFMAIQGLRRLYESITLTKPSRAKMWVGLWLIGIAYYLVMGISVWIEGASALNQPGQFSSLLEFAAPSLKTVVATPIFILASISQHICHKHLASLKKYTLPTHWLFQRLVCPHYTSECVVYVAICIVSAPKGQVLNRTVLAGLGFVVTNLGVTADSTRKWYVGKFGAEKVAGRWRMIPYIY